MVTFEEGAVEKRDVFVTCLSVTSETRLRCFVCMCVCVCVRACVRACVCVRTCVRAYLPVNAAEFCGIDLDSTPCFCGLNLQNMPIDVGLD